MAIKIPAVKAVKKTAAKRTASPAKKAEAYLFFNCDEAKSEGSKHISYNNAVYRDMKSSRKALWDKIQEEIEAGRVKIDEANLDAARAAVLEGNPTDAGQYLQYGDIVSVECY